MLRSKLHTIVLLTLGLFAAWSAGCGNDAGMSRVTGKVTVDGQIPAAGSSITFLPADGTAGSAGAMIENGNYSVEVPQGLAKVQIRVPRPATPSTAAPRKQGPGADSAGAIEESLPAKYHDQTELTLEVKAGANEKDWELSTK